MKTKKTFYLGRTIQSWIAYFALAAFMAVWTIEIFSINSNVWQVVVWLVCYIASDNTVHRDFRFSDIKKVK